MPCNKKIGILGGGQLAKYLSLSARKHSIKSVVYDNSLDFCAKNDADEYIFGDFLDENKLFEFSKKVDVVTYEFENVPFKTLDILEKFNVEIPQGKEPLRISQNRILEKTAIKNLSVLTPKFKAIKDIANLENDILDFGFPCVLKTTTGGYDGKGQWLIKSHFDIPKNLANQEYILEEFIQFDKEISCMVFRNKNGDIRYFLPSENIHKNSILQTSIMPARISKQVQEKVIEVAIKIIKSLNFIGPLAIEFFLKDEEIYFNEMAPRPHNSFHSSLDAYNFSQFDLHLMSVLGLKFADVNLIKPVVMLNILGQDMQRLCNVSDAKVYIYGKTENKINRKMGHINFFGQDLNTLILKSEKYIER